MPNSMQLLADEVIERALFCCDAFGPKMALNVTCGNATIPSLSGDKRTHRDHRQSVAGDPERTSRCVARGDGIGRLRRFTHLLGFTEPSCRVDQPARHREW
jgi:hypothetical protein